MLTLQEQAFAAGDYELANALAEISALEDEVIRLQNLIEEMQNANS